MASLDLLTPHLSKINLPGFRQLVYKDECVYSFDNPETETGLYVSLTSFLGFGRNYVEQYFQKTGNAVFLHIQREKIPVPESEQTGDGPEKKITRLAIGVEGGFDPTSGKPKFTYTDHYNLMNKSVQAVIDAESPFKIAEMAALQGTWDGEQREVSLELNQRTGEWHTLCESSSDLRPLHGPALTGLNNLGNSCYINCVMQVIFRIPDFVRRYVEGAPDIFLTFPDDPVNDFDVQTAKLGVGLLSGRYSVPSAEGSQAGVSPHMYRQLVGRDHPEFMSKRQQDAHEYYLHLLTLTQRFSRHKVNPGDCLRFSVEERLQCASGGVRYTQRAEQHLPLPVPLHAAANRREVDDFLKEEPIEQFYSSALDKKVTAQKITRLATFPDYLLIQLKKFTIKEDWTPAKLDVAVDMPWEPDETVLPESSPSAPAPVYNETLLPLLREMGFPIEACKKALYYTNNSGMEAASNWLMEHVTDWDFENNVEQIMSMGFTRPQAAKALNATDGNVERAVDWIFSHADSLDAVDAPAVATAPDRTLGCRDGPEKYRLIAFISHMGTSTMVGHYVCHVLHEGRWVIFNDNKYRLIAFISHMGTSTMVGHYVCHVLHEGRWVIFNDNKVSLSENPPKDLGYLYLYERL
ncbi:Ubiquitin carboxyl-terminal hydrolase [Operophtera brumata]|uniref:Ubiquitin carboxyl-terminal hydrolase n=1 Tax=Operophtera brumata TaxID=104452 RepID=A0A0L7LNA2_OPEBR|nr:Ubiquitin carboxyl-terminal hydrolase [Operophtera brumata]